MKSKGCSTPGFEPGTFRSADGDSTAAPLRRGLYFMLPEKKRREKVNRDGAKQAHLACVHSYHLACVHSYLSLRLGQPKIALKI